MLGFAVLHEGDVEITPEGRTFGEADIQTQKQLFREAALKNVAILRLIENTLHAKRDHAIGEEFFRDILDEHFSADEVERQFETALNWGRYAEIFDYDSETGRLFHREEADVLPVAGRGLMARSTWQPVRILGKGPWSLLPAQTWSVLTDFCHLRRRPVALLRDPGAGAHLVRPIQSSRRDLARSRARCRSTRPIRCCGSPSPTFSRWPSRWSTATSRRTTRAPSAS